MAIAGILFDKDGTLLDYFKSWAPVNRKLALIAAKGDQVLADHLLRSTGMDPETGHVVPDSLLAAGNTEEIAEGLVAQSSLPGNWSRTWTGSLQRQRPIRSRSRIWKACSGG